MSEDERAGEGHEGAGGATTPYTHYERMIEGVYAAAGYQEPVYYSKWFYIDTSERSIWARDAGGSMVHVGRMLSWVKHDQDVYEVELPFGSGDWHRFPSVYDAEDHVSRQLRGDPGRDHQATEKLRNLTCQCEHVGCQLRAENERLREALRGLRYGDGCFCDMAIGNPMVKKHSPDCERATSALENGGEE